jgi:hypothetical protein
LFFSWVTFTPEFSFASATGAAKCFQGFEDFQNVRWLGAGELFGEIGRHDGNLCGGSAIGKVITGAACALAGFLTHPARPQRFVVAARLQARWLKLTGRKAPVVVLLKNQWGQCPCAEFAG